MAPRRAAAVVTLAAVMGLAGCGGGDGNNGASFDMTIGHLVPQTGYLSDFGPSSRRAADLASDQIDRAIDGVGARQNVTIKHEDDHTDAQAGVKAARKLVDAESASCLVGAWADAVSRQVANDVSLKQEILHISPASTGDELSEIVDRSLINRTIAPDSFQGPALADAMEVDLGGAQGKQVNIGARDNAYGEAISRSFGEAWRAKGGGVGTTVRYDGRQRSYGGEAAAITAGDPDGFLIVDTIEGYPKLSRELVRTGRWDPRRTFVTDALASSSLPAQAGVEATEGLRGTTPGAPETGAAATAFDRLFASARDVTRRPSDAQTFDAVILCYLAAVAAGSPDGPAMAAELRAVSGPGGEKYTWEQLPDAVKALQDGDDIDYEGASGPIDLNPDGDPSAGVYDLFRYQDRTAVIFDEVPFEQSTE